MNGPQVEIRRYYKGLPATGHALRRGDGHGLAVVASRRSRRAIRHFVDDGWNRLRIVASGPRIQTWVNGQPVEDLVNEEVYKTHPRGFIGLQIHGLSQREVDCRSRRRRASPRASRWSIKWRNIRVRPLSKS